MCPNDGTILEMDKSQQLIGKVLGGHYQILSPIGAGGMSAVYKARHDMLDRIVAVKIMHAHMLAQQGSLARFQQEAKAASHLAHPNIISVHDFGVSQDEQVYLVMDYLEGISLGDVLAQEGHLAPQRAVPIFIQICDALHHAHHKGIIHRDLKPSNVMLVNTESLEDVVKIVDFGIAKLLPGAAIESQRLTQTGEVFGSPIYMSPEQCTGQTLDARSDVFSLGCVMYETLCGKPPFIGQNMLETMYIRLSDKAKPFDPELKVPKQLEAVIMIAIAREPENRYQTMLELRQDLEKISLGTTGRTTISTGIRQRLERVERAERSKKGPPPELLFVVGSAALIVLGYLVFREFTHPQNNTIYQDAWSKYDQQGQEQYNQGNYPEAEKLLNTAVDEAESFGEQDKRLAISLSKLAKLYRAEGKESEASKLEQRIANIKDQNPDSDEDQSNLNDLVDLTLSVAPKTFNKDKPAEAEKLVQKLQDLSARCVKQQNYEKAEQLLGQCLSIQKQISGSQSPAVADTLTALADVYGTQQGKYAQAEPLYQQALSIRSKVFGQTSSQAADSLYNLAKLYENQGKYPQSEQLYLQTIDMCRKSLPADHPDIARATSGLAGLYRLQGNYEKSEEYYQKALKLYQVNQGPDADTVAMTLNNLAGLAFNKGKYSQAAPLYQQAQAIYEKAYGGDDPSVATIINNLAVVLYKQGDFSKAEPLYKRALSIREKILPPDHPEIAQSLNSLAELYRVKHKYAEAEQLYKRALSITEKSFGVLHPEVARILSSIGQLYTDEAFYPQAEEFLKRSLEVRQRVYQGNHPEVASSLNQLANLYLKQQRYLEAEDLFKRSLNMRQELLGSDHPDVGQSLDGYSELLFKTNRFQDAIKMKSRSFSIWAKSTWAPDT
jgi:serine/threonine protein kinase